MSSNGAKNSHKTHFEAISGFLLQNVSPHRESLTGYGDSVADNNWIAQTLSLDSALFKTVADSSWDDINKCRVANKSSNSAALVVENGLEYEKRATAVKDMNGNKPLVFIHSY